MTCKTSADRFTATERRAQAVELRMEGKTFDRIGAELGVSRQRAYQLVHGALGKLQRETQDRVEEALALELERLDALQLAIYERATGGDLRAIDRMLRIMERRAKLLGLDTPQKVAPTNPAGDSPYQLRIHDMNAKERQARILELTRELGYDEKIIQRQCAEPLAMPKL